MLITAPNGRTCSEYMRLAEIAHEKAERRSESKERNVKITVAVLAILLILLAAAWSYFHSVATHSPVDLLDSICSLG
ncbi:MAG: hypothetical protein U0105_13785 [Candidatus Obscuribacterales bacterium]